MDEDLCDLDIQYGTGDWPGVRSHRLTWETLVPLCAPDLLESRPLRHPDDLSRHRLLHVLGYQEGWGVWLKAAGTTAVDPGQGLQVDTSLTAFELAAQGCGVALGRRSLAAREQSSGRLVRPFDLEVPITEAFHLLEPAERDPHPDAALFVAWLLETAARDHALPLDKTHAADDT